MEKIKIPQRMTVLGAGSWGATLANLLADNGHEVALWEFDPKASESLRSSRQLPILPDLTLHSDILVTSRIEEALRHRTLIICATPSHFVRSTMKTARASGALENNVRIVSVSKGLEEKTLKRMTEVISEELRLPGERIGVLSGPSHAEEVCRKIPTATVAASIDPAFSSQIQTLFENDFFRVYTHTDILGAELGGILKNIYAIACGISDGLELGDNTKAAIMTRGLNEMAKLGVKMGAQMITFFGLTGMGDLIVTCTSRHSRNRLLGEKIGRGKTPQQALAEMTMVAEGYKTSPSAYALAQKYELDCPLTREIYQILYEGKNPRSSIHALMSRETLNEWRGLSTT